MLYFSIDNARDELEKFMLGLFYGSSVLEMTFHRFLDIFFEILVAGAAFGEVGGGHLWLRAL